MDINIQRSAQEIEQKRQEWTKEVEGANINCTEQELGNFKTIFDKIVEDNRESIESYFNAKYSDVNITFNQWLDDKKNEVFANTTKFAIQERLFGIIEILQNGDLIENGQEYSNEIFENGFAEQEYNKIIEDKTPIKPSSTSIQENHDQVRSTLKNLCNLINEHNYKNPDDRIEYTLVGALPCYLQSMGDIVRYHDDLDFMINENDIGKMQTLLADHPELGFRFVDNRKDPKDIIKGVDENGEFIKEDSDKGHEHEIYAELSGSDFHLGFFPYEKTKDSVIQKQYYKDEQGNTVINAKKMSVENFERGYGTNVNFEGVDIRCADINTVKGIKTYMTGNEPRRKDVWDLDKWQQANLNLQSAIIPIENEIYYEETGQPLEPIMQAIQQEQEQEYELEKKIY